MTCHPITKINPTLTLEATYAECALRCDYGWKTP